MRGDSGYSYMPAFQAEIEIKKAVDVSRSVLAAELLKAVKAQEVEWRGRISTFTEREYRYHYQTRADAAKDIDAALRAKLAELKVEIRDE